MSLKPLIAVVATAALAVGSVLALSAGADAANSSRHAQRVQHWRITTSAVGPIELGETKTALKRAGYAYYPCGGDHHPCYFKGKLGQDIGFDVNAAGRVKQIMVNVYKAHGRVFATAHGAHVGTTVAKLKAKEHPKHLGNYGYGEAYAIHKGKHRWITFFTTGKTATSKVYSISVSTKKKPIQGR